MTSRGRWFAAAALGAGGAAMCLCLALGACSSDDATSPTQDATTSDAPTSPTDAGAKDARFDVQPDVIGSCSPLPVVEPLDASPRYVSGSVRAHACTSAQLAALYAACVDFASTAASCHAWRDDPANAACAPCAVTAADASAWGAVVEISDEERAVNTAGCYEATLGDDAGGAACGQARWTLDRCIRVACPLHMCGIDLADAAPIMVRVFDQNMADSWGGGGPCDPAERPMRDACPPDPIVPVDAGIVLAPHKRACPAPVGLMTPDAALAILGTLCGPAPADAGAD